MKTIETRLRSSVVIAAAVSFLFLTAKAGWAATLLDEPAIAIVKGETKQGYPFMSGGIGSSEREAMEKEEKAYNLKLAFAAKTGHYLAQVDLVIGGEKGEEIIRTTVDGPLFYIKLPPGKYRIRATVGGEAKQIDALDLPEKRRVFRVLHWDLTRRGAVQGGSRSP